ncbi:MAG: DUF3137 domain-containing protein [Planctomycetota bacterium]
MGFLRDVFGPSKEDIWRELCARTGASYVEGGFWRGDKVQAQVGSWTVTLDTFTESHDHGDHHHSKSFTRLRAPFVNPQGFHFTIYRASVFSPLGSLFGMQDIEIGDDGFDADFVIKGSDEDVAKNLLASDRIRDLLASDPAPHLTVKPDEGWFGVTFPEGVDELYFQTPGVVKDVLRLEQMFELFAETLHRLCILGAAYKGDPGVDL